MALQLRAKRTVLSTKFAGAFVAIAALLVQPFGALPLPAASAASPSDVWIKAAMPNPVDDDNKGEYVVLENKTASDVDLTGWILSDGALSQTLSGSIVAGATFKVCRESDATSTALPCDAEWASMELNNSGTETLTLTEAGNIIDQVTRTGSTEGIEVVFTAHAAALEASLNAENFNTHKGNDYKGISVGFNAADFGNVTDVRVELARADGSTVTKYGNDGVKSLISNQAGPVQLSAPFFIQEGTYTETSDVAYWQPAPATWSAATVPTGVSITITDEKGPKSVSNTSFTQPNSWTYESLLPTPAATPYSNGYEENTGDWTNFGGTVSRVASGTDNVSSATGGWHGITTGSAYTNWGGRSSQFPTGGYFTELDVYLDMNEADGSDKRFDFSSAINNKDGGHLRDFVLHLGTDPANEGQWLANASNNAPGNPSGTGSVNVSESGWYTLQHHFRDNGTGVLEVEMKLIKAVDGSTVGSWVRSTPSDVIDSNVGGNRYGWFTSQRFDFENLAIDNVRKGPVSQPTELTPPDTAGPALSNVSPASGAYKNSDFVASVDATDQTGVKKIALYVIDTGTGAKVKEYAMQSPTSGSTWNANVKLADIGGEGQYDLRFRAVDDLNNVTYLNNRGGNYLVNVDTTKPTGFSLKLADNRDIQGLTVGGEQTFIFTQQSEDNPQRIYIEYMEKDAGGTWRKKVGKEVLSDNRAELTVDTRSFADGLHQVKVSTRDMAGNSSGTTVQFTVDNVNPTITVKSESLGNKDQAAFRNISFKLYDKYNIDKFTIGTKTFDRTNAQYSDANFQNIKSALVQGSNTITLYDVAGNTTSYQFTYDSTPPAVNAGEDQGDIDGLSTTLSPETDVIEGMAWEMVSGPGIAEVTPIPNGSDVRVDVDTEGTYVLRLTAYDTAGNENFDDVTLTFVSPETEDDGGEETPATDTGSDTGAGTNGTPSNTASIPLATSPLAAVVTTNPTPFTTAFIGTQNNAATQSEATEQTDDGDILGTTATENDDNGEVAGVNDKAGWSIGDMAWYWWVVAVLGAMGLWLMIAAGIRRLRGSEV